MSKSNDVTKRTIYAEAFGAGYTPSPIWARRCGVFYIHEVNPGTVNARGVKVFRIGKGKVRVDFSRIALGPNEVQWPATTRGLPTPRGVLCAGGDGNHKQAVRDSFIATWDEVAL